MNHEFFMRRAISLAKRGSGNISPNPMVGAVFVKNNKIIAEGFHAKFGCDHAEISAIKNAKSSLKGATLYVNLEPCAHTGKTPPCANKLLTLGLAKVVIGMQDPNPQVAGKGIATLENAKIPVEVGILESECRYLNRAFIKSMNKKKPFITVKVANSLDGRICDSQGNSKWISNEKSRAQVQLLRKEVDAILVGANTVLSDNPHLGVRNKNSVKFDPLRVVIDPDFRCDDLNLQIYRDLNVLIVMKKNANIEKKIEFKKLGFELFEFIENLDLNELLSFLNKKGIIHLLVEGGGKTIQSFLSQGSIDSFISFIAPILIGGRNPKTAICDLKESYIETALRFECVKHKKIGNNIMLEAYKKI
jgi:diaminohydroxyphosphoribosylaminopyrimidine deaminase/5-amino-6-(5-phosphoribosylamino)uracil reductase